MGSAAGKYNVKLENSLPTKNTTLPTILYNSNRSKKENASLPRFIHRNKLRNSLSSTIDNLIIIWFDTEINKQSSNIDMQIKLKNLNIYLRIFDEINAFEHYIKNMNDINKEKIFLIISTILALTIIPQIHHISQIKYIYIYGKTKIDTNIQQQLLKKYSKIKGIFTKCQCLLTQINQDKNSNND